MNERVYTRIKSLILSFIGVFWFVTLIILEDFELRILVTLIGFVILSIVFSALSFNSKFNQGKWSHKLKWLEEGIYQYYKEVTNDFTTLHYDPNRQFSIDMKNDVFRLKEFIVNKNRFEELSKTDGLFYQLFYIYQLYYLLNGDVDKFVENYKYYFDTIDLRPEKRVLHQDLYSISFGIDYYDIPVELLELMYDFYGNNQGIDEELVQFKPTCKLDEMIYTFIAYQYYKATENKKMEEDYLRYKKLRSNLYKKDYEKSQCH